ncbi:2-oxoglutarate (2OG) and Fe(II)-dependent oxygenase superfamily protein [Euphorbia peplus]|nr:2-oxoglutarate (2OG) and Fe(II)-dependent oxygenase superfamily protein [Euphorbia peplus]
MVPRIPIVELSSEKLKAGSDLWKSGCQEVRKALEQHGCFELIYNKHTIENQNAILVAAEQVFNLPDEIKTKDYPSKSSLLPALYTAKSSFLPLYESVRIENAIDKQECQNLTHLMWPQGNQHFCETIHSHATLLAEILDLVVKMSCESYGIVYNEAQLKLATYLMKLMKYERSNSVDTKMGLLNHTDIDFVTILHQNHVKGLEIRIEYGEFQHWVPYLPSSHLSFIVIAGDTFMGWSNGKIKSCYHRVTMESKEVRYSVGLFGFMKGWIEVPKELVNEEHPLKYKPFKPEEYVDFHLSSNDSNKYEIDTLKVFCGI